jgi:hypothetical protein
LNGFGQAIAQDHDFIPGEKDMTADSANMDPIHKDREALRRELENALLRVNKNARRYRRLNTALLISGLIFGLLATALAADASKGGKVLASSVAEATTGKVPIDLPPGWRNICGIIALFTLIGTAATGINTVLKVSEHKAKVFVCAGSLDSLLTDLIPESNLRRAVLDKAIADFAKLRKDYAEYFR